MSVTGAENMTDILDMAANTVGDLSKNVVVREKCLKLMQYYSTFLCGYHEDEGENSTTMKVLNKAKNRMSAGRKALRFLRCTQHLAHFKYMCQELQGQDLSKIKPSHWGRMFDELCTGLYFIGDNHLLLKLAGILPQSDFAEALLYYFDFMADVTCVTHSLLARAELQKEKEELEQRLHEIQSLTTPSAVAEKADIRAGIATIDTERWNCAINCTVSALQTINSGNYPGVEIWRKLFGAPIPETWVGLSGILSSSIVVWQVWPSPRLTDIAGENENGASSSAQSELTPTDEYGTTTSDDTSEPEAEADTEAVAAGNSETNSVSGHPKSKHKVDKRRKE